MSSRTQETKMKSPEGERDSSLLQINSVLQPMFLDIAEVINTKIFVIVDALDECSDWTAGFLDALNALPESGVDIRVLVSSRPDDHIIDDLREVPCPRIARKSDGMIQYANMVIENLKQSKAVRINVQLLMKRLPDGMSDLYKQILERLQEDDREMLLTVLRWLMCSEGKIEIALVLDDIERCYEDLGTDEDDSEIEDIEDSDNSSAVIGVSKGMEPQEENIDYKDRESVKRLKTVGRDCLKFSSAVVDIQHKSVRDFISSEEKWLAQDPRICSDCTERMNQVSTYQAFPKHEHLIMAKYIFRKLMPRSFQDKFITIKGFEKDKLNAAGLTSESVALQHGPDIGIENLAPKVTVSLGTETTELATHIAAEAEKDNPISNLPDFGSDEEEPPRYELAQWSRHLRAAEEAWPAAERDTDLQEHEDEWTSLEWTPHHFACWKNGGNIGIELLAQHDADVNALERIKQTLLSVLAAGSGSPKLFQYLLHLGAKPELFLDHDAKVNEQDKESQGPLYAACPVGNVPGARLLFEYETDSDDDDDVLGRTAMLQSEQATLSS
ncbi:hypothetical protein HO133_006185 [Letharia lupina]|uniref:Nephrocystin 3-like N-terminal domain-containing protein n=1 Tax=Letharia lupina TaxID=560253 RepID=A0A8H6F863_9LECA|nr:uncharacterized protein HO133_006185 [Letharia lupina]KAF6218224.1 hypothetical protein HO133_006185 [Letharia lupina]